VEVALSVSASQSSGHGKLNQKPRP
jgi:hypothetical protein